MSSAVTTSDSCNSTKAEHESEAYIRVYGGVLTAMMVTSLPAILAIGVNVLRKKKLRTISNALMLNLCFADLVVVVVNLPPGLASLWYGLQPAGPACRALGFINMLSFVGSVIALSLISINRYVAVCKNQHLGTWFSPERTAVYVVVSWSFTVALSLPPLFGWCDYAFIEDQNICFADWAISKSYTVFMVAVCFGGPASIMISTNGAIFIEIRLSRMRIAQQAGASNKSHETIARRREIKLAKTMMILIVGFVVCWMPYCVNMLLGVFGDRPVPSWLPMLVMALGYSNSVFNPFMYGVINMKKFLSRT